MEDEIVFLQPLGGIGFDDRGGGEFELLLDDAGGQALEVGVPDPAAGELDELVPIAGKGELEDHADDTVVEIFDLALQALAAFENQRLEGFFHRRALKADVAGSHVLEAGIDGARAEDAAKIVEADLLADIELDHDKNGAAEGSVVRSGRDERRQGLGGNFANGGRRDCGFVLHCGSRGAAPRRALCLRFVKL